MKIDVMTKDKDIKTVVPPLRFPEFSENGEWTIVPLKKHAKLITEKAKNRNYMPLSVTSGVGLVSQMEKFGREIAGEQYKNYYVINKFDFAYNKSATTSYPEGYISMLKNFDRGAVPNSIFTCFSVDKNEINPQYLDQLFQDNFHGKWLRNYIEIGSRANGALSIDSKILLNMLIPLPKLKEQLKIKDCLSCLDDLISAVADKIETLKEYKKGLTQQLFPTEGKTTPAFRFPEFQNEGKWMLLPIKKYNIDILTGYAFRGSEILEDNDGTPLMRGINITEGVVRHNNDIDRFYSGEDHTLSKYRLLCNDLVIAMDGSKVGRNFALINKQDEGSLLVQRVARLRADNIDFIMFIYQQIGSDRFKTYIDRINTSSGIPHISLKQIEDFKIWTTRNDKEFRMVTNCLSSVDELISTETAKLDQLKAHKKGLMQQLFPKLQ